MGVMPLMAAPKKAVVVDRVVLDIVKEETLVAMPLKMDELIAHLDLIKELLSELRHTGTGRRTKLCVSDTHDLCPSPCPCPRGDEFATTL